MAKIGCFRCSRTGLLFPSDYVENWGKKYGIGLGSVPVSEALVNLYDGQQPVGEGENKMFAVGVCRAPISYQEVEQSEYDDKKAVIAIDDISYALRAPIMRSRQISNKKI